MHERRTYTYPRTHDELLAAMAQGKRERARAFARWLSPRRRDDEIPTAARPAHGRRSPTAGYASAA